MYILLFLLAIPVYFILIFYIRLVLEFVIVVFKIAEAPSGEEKGLFKSLFDTNFDVFLTPRLIKIIYKLFLFGLPIRVVA